MTWAVFVYESTALFSLKISSATSSGGKSLLVPTPYAVKMAFIDAAFRSRWPLNLCEKLLLDLRTTVVRVGVPEQAVVTHTFVKVRQETRGDAAPTEPYQSTIAYREVVHHRGPIQIAFGVDVSLGEQLGRLAPAINYFGKRGSFFQFVARQEIGALAETFTQILQNEEPWDCPAKAHIVPFDDFGPEATLGILSSFNDGRPRRDKHRTFNQTIIPLAVVNAGPGFTEYAR